MFEELTYWRNIQWLDIGELPLSFYTIATEYGEMQIYSP